MSSSRNIKLPARVLVIFNPIAGRRRQVFFRKTLAKLEATGIDLVLQATTARGDAETFARTAVASDSHPYDMIIAAGGDGTINEVVNGLRGARVPLGIIPLGTANLLAREIGLGRRSWQVAPALARGATREIRVGEAINASGNPGRRFLMMAGIGYDAGVVSRINIKLKYRWGKAAYALAGFMEWLRGTKELVVVCVDGETHEAAWVVIAKGRQYAGGFSIARKANLADNYLTVCIMPGKNRRDLARYLFAILFARIEKQPDVTIVPAQNVSVRHSRKSPVEIDGDLFGTLPINLSVAPETVSLVTPA